MGERTFDRETECPTMATMQRSPMVVVVRPEVGDGGRGIGRPDLSRDGV